MSGVGRIAEETRQARGIVEVAIAEAKSVHGEVESRVASLVAQAEASTAHIADALSKCVSEGTVQNQAKMLRAVGAVAQQLEKETEAAAVSTITTSEQRTGSAVNELHAEIRAQNFQNRADFEQRQE